METEFDVTQYEEEMKRRWSRCSAYQEYAGQKLAAANLMRFRCTEEHRSRRRAGQDMVTELQNSLTANYYTCTDEVLAGLGEMYFADGRFRNQIDKAGGRGTAAFVSSAIRVRHAGT